MPNSRAQTGRNPVEVGPVALAGLAATLMLLLAVATVVSVSLAAPWEVAVPLAAASLAVRPLAVLYHRRHHRTPMVPSA